MTKAGAQLLPFIGGLVGALIVFIGVLAGQLLAHRLTQRRDEQRKEHEFLSLCSALEAEIHVNLVALQADLEHAQALIENQSRNFPLPKISKPIREVYHSNVGMIGRLQPEQAEKIVRFYAQLKSVEERDYQKSSWERMASWQGREWEQLRDFLREIIASGDEAITEIHLYRKCVTGN